MSDCRLETGDCDERRFSSRMPSPVPLDVLKVEEISLGLLIQHHCSQSIHGPSSPAHPTTPLRAGYLPSAQCRPIAIQSRVVGEWDQKAPRTVGGGTQGARTPSSNETKNIAKNYGKAIIAFMQRNKRIFRAICRATATPYQRISEELPELKAALTTVMGFRRVWTSYKYAECMRMVSQVFLRKSALPYIFNSKVANVQTHLKYRARFLKALRSPAAFDHIKDY